MTIASKPRNLFAAAAEAFTSAEALDRVAPPEWRDTARPEQLPPADWKRVWYMRGGRDSGKTYAGAHNLADMIHQFPGEDWAVLAPTFGDARDVCVEGRKSGLLRALGPLVVNWNRSIGEIILTTGGRVFVDGADDGALRVQGKRLAGAWCDEIGLWKRWEQAWDESLFYAVTENPGRIIATGTPKSSMPARKLVQRLLDDPDVPVSLLTTESNRANIAPEVYEELMSRRDTRLGRQELFGELLDAEGVIWRTDWIDKHRVQAVAVPKLVRTIVMVDPSGSTKEGSAETGIVVIAQGIDGDAYVLADRSIRAEPSERYLAVCGAAADFDAHEIIAEEDFGADNIPYLLKQAWVQFARTDLRARRLMRVPVVRSIKAKGEGSKRERATFAAHFYELGCVHHVVDPNEPLNLLEDQLTTWAGDGPSPDRLDALAHGVRLLLSSDEVKGKKQVVTGGRWGSVSGRR